MTPAFGFLELALDLEMFSVGLSLFDDLCVCEKGLTVGPDDLEVVGAFGGFKTHPQQRTHESHHVGDLLKVVSDAQPPL